MAELQDSVEDSDVGELETVEAQDKQVAALVADDDVPEVYRGKSVKDVIKMHQEAQKLIGRQGQEVHEVRKLADELIKSQLVPKKVDEPKPVDFFENPQEAIRQQIESNPRLMQAEAYAKQAQAEQARLRLMQMHPDALQLAQSEDFRSWVNASKVRQSLFNAADSYNVDAANELFSTFKELRAVKQQKVDSADNSAREKALSAASVDTGGSGESTRKVYRRADLIKLKMSNPAKYEAMNDEILAAYSEGRVK